MQDQLNFNTDLLRGLSVDPQATVSLTRVIEQRLALAELYSVAMLQPALQPVLNEAARVAAKGCRAPLAKVLEQKRETGQFLLCAACNFKPGYVGNLVGGTGVDNPPGQCLAERRPVVVRDVTKVSDYRLARIFADHGVVASANVPIIGSPGIFGVLEIDATEARDFDALDLSFLISVAGLIGETIERVRRQAALRAELDAQGVLLREQQHRVRNHFQMIQGLLSLQALQATSEDSRQRFEELERRVFALSSFYDHLLGVDLSEQVDLAAYLNDLCGGIRRFYEPEARNIALRFRSSQISASVHLDACTAIGAVVAELVANALEHAFQSTGGESIGGEITIGLAQSAGRLIVSVEDDGIGFTEAREEGTGLKVVRRLLQRIDATLTRQASSRGTSWLISLPQPS